jgi:hypothetical protein
MTKETQRTPSEYKIKIGLIVDSNFASTYVKDLAVWGQSQRDLEISHLVIQERDIPNSNLKKAVKLLFKRGFREFVLRLCWEIVCIIESVALRWSPYRAHTQICDLTECVPSTIKIRPILSKSGFTYRFSDDDIEKLAKYEFDLLIRCASGILRGKILNASRFGVLSFHHADNRVNRGGPPGFWEVYHRDDTTGFIIQQLTEELDGGNVLFRGAFPTRSYYLLNQATLYTRSNFYMKKLLLSIAKNRNIPDAEQSLPYYNMLFKRPTVGAQLSYLTKLLIRILIRAIISIVLRKRNRWGVGFYKSDWRNIVMWKSGKIKNPPNHFLADPFVVTEGNSDYCFVEDYNYATNRGCISVYEIRDNQAIRLGEAIAEPFHMSFPYVFKFNSKLYMVPETSENSDIRLYECIEFPKKWQLLKVIMSDISAADTMVFEHNGLWWLFSNIDPVNTGDHCSELSIFYATNPIVGDWAPHLKNPVIINPASARNGGLLCDNESIFRVGQRQGFGRYGTGVSINKIERLDENEYKETNIFNIEAGFLKDVKGTHHFHSNGKVTVFDFVGKSRVK